MPTPTDQLVDEYCRGLLAPRLKTLGLNKERRAQVCADVRFRLQSLLAHWQDETFLRTLLTLAEETALHWEPRDTRLTVRGLVVLAVRNSALEDLHIAPGRTRQVLSDHEMPVLTSEAIRHFDQLGHEAASPVRGPDLFGTLPQRFPAAWRRLAHLAVAENSLELAPEPVCTAARSVGPAPASTRGSNVVANGMDPGYDPQLRSLLEAVRQGQLTNFVTPSFSRLTRNPEKLLAVLEHLVRHGASLVTHNYLLGPDFVARRSFLMRPAHDVDEAQAQQQDLRGLVPRHAQVLAAA